MTSSLRLIDGFRDRELLCIIKDHADDEGWADSQDIADAVGLKHKHPTQCVGARLSWLARYGTGLVERHPDEPAWRLTDMGEAMTNGTLSAAMGKQLEHMKPEQLVMLTRSLTSSYQEVPDEVAHMVRREFTSGSYGRKFRPRRKVKSK